MFVTECATSLGELVSGVPGSMKANELGDMCPCRCNRWATPPVCGEGKGHSEAEAAGVGAAWREMVADKDSDFWKGGGVGAPPNGPLLPHPSVCAHRVRMPVACINHRR